MSTDILVATTRWTEIDSPVGALRLVARDGAVVAIQFDPFVGEVGESTMENARTMYESTRRAYDAAHCITLVGVTDDEAEDEEEGVST